MAFDAGMLSCLIRELGPLLTGGKIEKIYMPQKDAAVFSIKNGKTAHRLLINAGSSSPHLCVTAAKAENPEVPPMFCMMLRKHLNGAKLSAITQLGFERAVRFTFETYDDLGFRTEKHVIAEIMGKFSNLLLTDAADRIIGLLRPVDFTTSQKRQLLPGMTYELPPKQDRADPTAVDREEFNRICAAADPEAQAQKVLMNAFAGLAPITLREIAYRAGGRTDATMSACESGLWNEFEKTIRAITADGVPVLVTLPDGTPKEYSYVPIAQYGSEMKTERKETFSELVDAFFEERTRIEAIRQKASDVLRLIGAAENRLNRKLALQTEELLACEEADKYRLYGDLLTANLYRMKKGSREIEVENYYADPPETLTIPLDVQLQPAQNAQKYYKKYNKAKSARTHLTEQIALTREELAYVMTVSESLARAENERDLTEIRNELYLSGYASKMKNYAPRKAQTPVLMHFRTTRGRDVYCGKSNTANDYLTTKYAEKTDWWFHVKGQPGSHVVMKSAGEQDEPTEEEFTQAASVAAIWSKASGGVMTPVDYTRVRYVKKPAGSKPGFVIYTTNWTAYVTPDKREIEGLRVQ